MSLKLPNGCYVESLTLRLCEPDCCTSPDADPKLTVTLLDGGGGHYPRIDAAETFGIDADDFAAIGRFLAAVSRANDGAVAAWYEKTTPKGGAT